jgi:catechol 2,3-dioxygenase-like lactoylglutathione lyase family enzyme
VLIGIDHVVLYVADVEASLRWYRDHFALEVERLDEFRAGTNSFASLRVSDTFIIDLVPRIADGKNVDHIAFVTDRQGFDLFAERHADLVEVGPRVLSGAQGSGDALYLRDPDDHRLELRTYD